MKRILAASAMALCLMTHSPAFGQSSFATVSGTISDATGALIPGVSVTATNTATNVVSMAVSNEAGAYNVPALLPGTYKVSAELPGFQTQTYTAVELGNAAQIRLNFTLTVANVAQSVEVTIAADTVLATSSPTIGQVLGQQKVQDLPLVGNNVLDLIGVMSGVDNIATGAFGRENTTFAGVSAAYISTVRDGVMVQDTRFPTGINSATVINPDLVGEVRLILAPVDAEIGRGNGTVQIQTRSGTNQYRGGAAWFIRNTALDPNTWTNNRNPGTPLQRNWTNTHQTTFNYGGPIVKNKTFFFALYDRNDSRSRSNTNPTVLTPCARNGIFRYFDNWNNANWLSQTTLGNTPTTAVVDVLGNPKAPATNPNGSPHNGILRYASIYGPVTNTPVKPDCSDAVVGRAPTASGFWDANRTQIDPTGFVKRTMDYMPQANNFDVGDGLNTAGYRFLRHTGGLDNLFGVGEATGIRNQINVKIDHNFSTRHKGNINVSYERVHSDDVVEGWPGTFSNLNYRRPFVVTAAFTSTLSAHVLNEARWGIRRTGTNVVAPWDRPEYQEAINAYLPKEVNGFRVLPRLAGGFCSPISGSRPPGSCNGGAFTSTSQDVTPVWTYADTLSWTKGKHSYKFGGELRLSSSSSTVSNPGFFSDYSAHVQAIGGQTTAGAIASTGTNSISSQNPLLSGLANTSAGTMRNIMNFFAGSLSSITNLYFLTDAKKLDTFSDYRTGSHLHTTLHQTEISAFFKDDYKVHRDVTLNLGLRYEWYGVPYAGNGLTVSPVGGGSAAFGISGRGFESWQKTGGPVAYDPKLLTALEFVGPDSPNPNKSVYPNDWNNLGPAIGFAWQVPWFGKGKTSVRGGYQVTFQGGGRFQTLEPILSAPPGSTYQGQYIGDTGNAYLDLTDLSAGIPAPVRSKPMQPVQITDRNQGYTAFDPNYVSPYVQNLTLSVTRSVRPNLSVDVRYIGTMAVKQFRSFNLNIANFMQNGLINEFERIRTGGESPMLDEMFNGINLCTGNLCGNNTSIFGAVGSTVNGVKQTAALQMRSSSTFQANLANGNYSALAGTINTLNYSKVGGLNPGLPDVASGINGTVMRYSGKFPENFIVTNPQFSAVTYMTNADHDNYHSVQTEVTLRPTHGLSGQGTYSWSKNLGLGTFTDPRYRSEDYTIVGGNREHQFRANGVVQLPIGPNQLLFRNSSGLLARLTERWQIGWIYNLSSGSPTSISAQSMLYGNGVPDIVGPLSFKELFKGSGVRWGVPVSGTGQLNGSYFDPEKFVYVPDSQCSRVTTLQNLNGTTNAAGVFTARCSLDSVAMIVTAGTPGSFVLDDGTGRSAQIVLQHPEPGKRGTLGSNVIEGLGTWRFDANVSKEFHLTETKSFRLRIDCTNVLNHPQPAGPNLSINQGGGANPTPFGGITSKSGNRAFQGTLRFNF